MLIEFSIKNFLSFKEKVTLSLEKESGNENEENTFTFNNEELLKTAVIYGANASGKSNLIKAFTIAILMVRNSNMISLGGKWDILKPFLFSEDTNNSPSEFEFIFIANKIKYRYFFIADEDKIYNESLDAYYSQKPTNIFTRKNTTEYSFINSDKKTLESIASKNTENKLFLSTATTWNYEKTKDAFLWFLNSIDTYGSFDSMLDQDLINYSNNDEDLKKFTLKLLKESDIFIKDLRVSYEERDVENSSFIINNQKQGPLKTKSVKIAMDYEITDSQDEKKIYTLDFEDESSGTKILFVLAPILKRAFEKTKIIIVDELEKSLHPTLVKYIIKLFNNEKLNTKNSQLIFTTHAISLLSLDLFRRDQIWFTEKDVLTGNSDLYPLDSFSVRKEENIEKGYINGRYGAVPFIKDIDSWLEEK